jgi:hypothetical protein
MATNALVFMGYAQKVVRKSAWQFLHRTNDLRVNMLRKFARAVVVSLRELVEEEQRP